ncbi:MAG: hypothetical protein AMXMBFR83_17340 [Phycisphaerae bacterium]
MSASVEPVIPLLAYQRADVESEARYRWCCWSRQTGKSFTKSLRRLLRGMLRRRNQILLSAGERQSRELMLKVRQHCRALNIAASESGPEPFEGLGARSLSLELPNGVRVIGLPANPQTARGFTGDVLLDEFAMHRDDRAIWAAVFPSVLRGGGELDVASTPKGRDNLFAQLRENERFERSVVTLEEAVAAGLEVDIEAIRQGLHDDELYRQEFLCAFRDEAAAFLTYEQIRRVEEPMLEKEFDLERLGAARGPLYVGMDIGRHRDLTVIWVLEAAEETPVGAHPGSDSRRRGWGADDSTAGTQAGRHQEASRAPVPQGGGARPWTRRVLVTRGVRESRGEPFREQSAALHALLSLRQVRRCCIDAGGMGLPLAEAAVEAFGASRVESVTFTAAVKDDLAGRLRLRVEEGTIRIPVDEAIRNDWHSVRRSVTATGPARYEAAHGGGHADRFWAACLAVRAAGKGANAGAIEAIRGAKPRFARVGAW